MSRVAILALLALAELAYAMPPNPCTAGWPDSVKQSSFTCDGAKVKQWTIDHLAYAFIPMAIGCGLFLACPIFFIGRYFCLCCGSSRVRPGYFCIGGAHWDGKPDEEKYEAYSMKEVQVVRIAAFVALVVPILYFIGAYTSAGLLFQTIDDVVSGALALISYLLKQADLFAASLQTTDGQYPADFASFVSQYDSTVSSLKRIQTEYAKNQLIDQVKSAVAGLAFPVLFPAGAMVIGAIAAFLRLRSWLPMLATVVLFLLAGPFGVASSFFLIAAAPIEVACAEADAQLARQPGLFQNYVIPNCDSVNPVAKLNATLNDLIGSIATDGCAAADRICDGAGVYIQGTSAYFYCDRPVSCKTYQDLAGLVASVATKPSAPNPCGSGPCTLESCQTDCTATFSGAGNASATILLKLNELNQIQNAVKNSELLAKYPTCNSFIDFVIKSIPLCAHGPAAFEMLGASCMLVVFGNLAGIVIFTLGSKRFIDRERYERGSNAVFGKSHANMNACTVATRPQQQREQPAPEHEMEEMDVSLL